MTELPAFLTDDDLETTLKLHDGWAAKDRLRPQPRIQGWIKIGSSVRYPRESVQAFISQNMKATAA